MSARRWELLFIQVLLCIFSSISYEVNCSVINYSNSCVGHRAKFIIWEERMQSAIVK